MEDNIKKFQGALERAYIDLQKTSHPDYVYTFQHNTPDNLARTMTRAFRRKSANKEGLGVRRACKGLGINYTYKAIYEYLGVE